MARLVNVICGVGCLTLVAAASAATPPFGSTIRVAPANVGFGGAGDVNLVDSAVIGHTRLNPSERAVARWSRAGRAFGPDVRLGPGSLVRLELAPTRSRALAILEDLRRRQRILLISPAGVLDSDPMPPTPQYAKPAGGGSIETTIEAATLNNDGTATLALLTRRTRSAAGAGSKAPVLRFLTRSRAGVWRDNPGSILRLAHADIVEVRFSRRRGVVVAWDTEPLGRTAARAVVIATRADAAGAAGPGTGAYSPGWQQLPGVISTPSPRPLGASADLTGLEVTESGTIVVGTREASTVDEAAFGRIHRLPVAGAQWSRSEPLGGMDDLAVTPRGIHATTLGYTDATRTRVYVDLATLDRATGTWGTRRVTTSGVGFEGDEIIGAGLTGLRDGRLLVDWATDTGPGPNNRRAVVAGPTSISRSIEICSDRESPTRAAGTRRALIVCEEDGGEGVFAWNIGPGPG